MRAGSILYKGTEDVGSPSKESSRYLLGISRSLDFGCTAPPKQDGTLISSKGERLPGTIHIRAKLGGDTRLIIIIETSQRLSRLLPRLVSRHSLS